MSRTLTPGTARLCPAEPGASIEDAFPGDRQPAVLEQLGAAEPEHLPKDRTRHGPSSGRQVTRERQEDQRFLGGRELDRRHSVCGMTRWRWMHDPQVAFPRPVKLGNGRNYWWLPDILEWERRRADSENLRRTRGAEL
jgi:predicted DNA-binding transcriptional regulator AlpA